MTRAAPLAVLFLVSCGGRTSGANPGVETPYEAEQGPSLETGRSLSPEDEALLTSVAELMDAGAGAPEEYEPLLIDWNSLDDLAMGYTAVGDEKKAREIVSRLVDEWEDGKPLYPSNTQDLFKVIIALGDLETLRRCEAVALRHPETWRDFDLEALVGLYGELSRAANPAESEELGKKALDAIQIWLDLKDELRHRKTAAKLLVKLGEDGKAQALAQESEDLFEQMEDRIAADVFDMAGIFSVVGNEERARELAVELESSGERTLALIVYLSLGLYENALGIELARVEGEWIPPYWVSELYIDLAQLASGSPALSALFAQRALDSTFENMNATDQVLVLGHLLSLGDPSPELRSRCLELVERMEILGCFGHAASMLIALGDTDGASKLLARALARTELEEGDYQEPYIETAEALEFALRFAKTDEKGREIARSMAAGFIWNGYYQAAMEIYIALSDSEGIEDLLVISDVIDLVLVVARLHVAHWEMTGNEASRSRALEILDGCGNETCFADDPLLVASLYEGTGEKNKSEAAYADVDPAALDEESLVKYAVYLSAHGFMDDADQIARDLESDGKLESAFRIFDIAGNKYDAKRLFGILLSGTPAKVAPLARFAVTMEADKDVKTEAFQSLYEQVTDLTDLWASDDFLETLVILRDAGFKKADNYLKQYVKKKLDLKVLAQLSQAHLLLGNPKKARAYLEESWTSTNEEEKLRMMVP